MAATDTPAPEQRTAAPWVEALEARLQPIRTRFATCLPIRLRQAIIDHDRRLLVEPDDSRARLTRLRGNGHEPVGVLALDADDPLPAALAEYRRRTTLRLPKAAILRRSISLPVQVKPRLAEVLYHELDRLSPFPADQLFYAIRLQPTPKHAPRLRIELVLCPRAPTEAWLARLAQAGATVERIDWAGAWHRANLLPPQRRTRRPPPWPGFDGWLGLLALTLLIAALATPLWQRHHHLARLQQALDQARTQALATDRARQALEQARQGNLAVLAQRQRHPQALELLRKLSTRLPDDTWIQRLEFDGQRVELVGESASATALIGLLEHTPGIESVRFLAPVVQIDRDGGERFNLAFQLHVTEPTP
ncbi:PilN domain-containing protein [Marichromatium bheemlicum]|uniref:PilN domain-containing protein n=1 Tax=Marichromatium bheemlicum TaxID=365339 RepID=A0ABX1I5H2_9GAMM|nr:PilN domain-containing protein [Marichromatium bheemlicum]NKN32827.1 PilN domain-containing protein [Marichromatium bheemlicum]